MCVIFQGSESAGESAAILLFLIQSARATGINPQAYLEGVMRRIMSHPLKQARKSSPSSSEEKPRNSIKQLYSNKNGS